MQPQCLMMYRVQLFECLQTCIVEYIIVRSRYLLLNPYLVAKAELDGVEEG